MGITELLIFTISGFFIGLLAGFIGIGGNIILIPLTLEIFRAHGIPSSVRTHLAYGTMLSVTAITMLSSTIRQTMQKLVLWRFVPWFVVGSLLSTQLLGGTLKNIHGSTLQFIFATMILILGVQWLIHRNRPDSIELCNLHIWLIVLGGILIGVIALLTGLGGGVILIPLLAGVFGVPTKNLAGTSSAVLIFTASAAALSYLWGGIGVSGLPEGAVGYVWPQVAIAVVVGTIPGAQIGAILNKKHASKWFRLTFASVQILMSIWMFARAIQELP